MTVAIALLLVILVVALILFSFEWVPADVTALGVMLALVVLGLVPLDQAFAGFGSDTVMLLLGLLILTAALLRTGIVQVVERRMLLFTDRHPGSTILAVMVVVGLLSSIINNTAAAAIFLPLLLAVGQRGKFPASRLLMPMAFAAILASSMTLIATSTNVVVSGLMVQFGLPPIGMFELTPVGIVVLAVGILYMVVIGQRLIPVRPAPQTLTETFEMRPYLAELRVLPGSDLAGKSLSESGLGRLLNLTVLVIIRGDQRISPDAFTSLEEGDALLVEGSYESILKVKNLPGIAIQADVKFSDSDLLAGDVRLAEAVLLPGSMFLRRTIKDLQLREKYHVQVLAINHHSGMLHEKIADTRLSMGDVLLVQSSHETLAALHGKRHISVLGMLDIERFNRKQAWLVGLIFAGAIVAGATRLLPLPVAMLLGALLCFLTRSITPEEAYQRVDWRVLILIGSMLALGAAMQYTGTAQYLAGRLASALGDANPLWLLSGFFVLTVLLTQPMSNQAAAAVVIPLALQTAVQLDLNPRTFAMMIAIAASTSYLTPLEPACLMVYGPGRYRFIDFVKVGGLLTLLIYLIAIGLVPLLWPLR